LTARARHVAKARALRVAYLVRAAGCIRFVAAAAPDVRLAPVRRTYTHPVSEAAANGEVCIKVRLFASYREVAKTNRLDLALPAGATVSDLIDLLAERVPALRTAPGMVAVNYAYVNPDFTLHDGDEAAFIPPVSGGA
jgi:molybdopterin converting factor subunit 1